MPNQLAPNVLSWASDIDEQTKQQAARTARMPFIHGHIALMPDAHLGIGATVGSVIPTTGAIMPAAVGVDIGCGMVAVETTMTATDLPDDLDELMPLIEQAIPAGVGQGHTDSEIDYRWDAYGLPDVETLRFGPSGKQVDTAVAQFGTLGSGNHFVEVCLDERDHVWTVLHSGSRGIGNQVARHHIDGAKKMMKRYFIDLDDPDLAYLVQGTPEFDNYIADMMWAQRYAMSSRAYMSEAATNCLFDVCAAWEAHSIVRTINCHHNFTQREHFGDRDLWITRKGAIQARQGDHGVIPGSMGTRSYIVSGNGVKASWNSCSHGAGRRMSRTAARKTLTVDSLNDAMAGKSWNSDKANALLDEHPASYKDIDQVMADQADLVTVEHTLRQVFNYKGA